MSCGQGARPRCAATPEFARSRYGAADRSFTVYLTRSTPRARRARGVGDGPRTRHEAKETPTRSAGSSRPRQSRVARDVFQVEQAMGHPDLDELARYVHEAPQARAVRILAAFGKR